LSVYKDKESRLVSFWAARRASENQRAALFNAVIKAVELNGQDIEEVRVKLMHRPSEEEILANPEKFPVIGKVPRKPELVKQWERRREASSNSSITIDTKLVAEL